MQLALQLGENSALSRVQSRRRVLYVRVTRSMARVDGRQRLDELSEAMKRSVTGVERMKQSATLPNDLSHLFRLRRTSRLVMSDNAKTGATPSGLGRCTDCEAVYPIRRSGEGWRAVGTDGTCRCGGDQFTLMKSEEPTPRGTSRVSSRAH